MAADEPVELSIVLPAYNEGAAIVLAIEAYAAALADIGVSYELLVVDDGSKDDTAARAEEAARRHPGVVVLRNQTNRGQVASILRGFAESRGTVVTHNGVDLPFSPGDTGVVLDCLRAGAEVVVVERASREAYGWGRKITSWANVGLSRALLRSPFWDHNFVQAYRRSVLDRIEVESTGVSTVTTELILKAVRLGCDVRAVRAPYQCRRTGRSSITLRKVLRAVPEFAALCVIMGRYRPPTAAATNLTDGRTSGRCRPSQRSIT